MIDAPRQKVVSVGERELSTDPHIVGQVIPLLLECGHTQHGAPHFSFRPGEMIACYACRNERLAQTIRTLQKPDSEFRIG